MKRNPKADKNGPRKVIASLAVAGSKSSRTRLSTAVECNILETPVKGSPGKAADEEERWWLKRDSEILEEQCALHNGVGFFLLAEDLRCGIREDCDGLLRLEGNGIGTRVVETADIIWFLFLLSLYAMGCIASIDWIFGISVILIKDLGFLVT